MLKKKKTLLIAMTIFFLAISYGTWSLLARNTNASNNEVIEEEKTADIKHEEKEKDIIEEIKPNSQKPNTEKEHESSLEVNTEKDHEPSSESNDKKGSKPSMNAANKPSNKPAKKPDKKPAKKPDKKPTSSPTNNKHQHEWKPVYTHHPAQKAKGYTKTFPETSEVFVGTEINNCLYFGPNAKCSKSTLFIYFGDGHKIKAEALPNDEYIDEYAASKNTNWWTNYETIVTTPQYTEWIETSPATEAWSELSGHTCTCGETKGI